MTESTPISDVDTGKLPMPEPLDPDQPGQADDIPPVEAPAIWDHESDVVIVGGGGAGLSAAAAALRNGSTVTVLEKQAVTGGHSQHAAMAASFDTEASRRKGLPFDRQAAYRQSFVQQSNGTMDPRLLATLIDRSREIYDWSETQSWGQRWEALTMTGIPDPGVARMMVKGSMPQGVNTTGTQLMGQMYPWMQWLAQHVAEKGGKILRRSTVLGLVQEGGRITGVKAQDESGRVFFARGSKGVILAGAGFANNREMIKRHCPEVYAKAVGTFFPPSDTGEVVRMALGAGADLAGRNSWIPFAGGIPFYDTDYTGKDEPGPWFQYLRQGWIQLATGIGWLEVNANCKEFMPAAVRTDAELRPKAIAAQPGAASYVLFDDNYSETIWETTPPPMLDRRPNLPDDPEYDWSAKFADFVPKNWRDSVEQAIGLGGIKVAETISDLATQLGLDPAELTQAVDAWNTKASATEPDEFGRLPQNVKPILKAPFYGIKTGPLIAGIFCGPRVNERMEVLDTAQRAIPGLYAAGLTAGGANGEGVTGSTVVSNLGLAYATGWIAGDSATSAGPAWVTTDMTLELAAHG